MATSLALPGGSERQQEAPLAPPLGHARLAANLPQIAK